MAKRKRKKKSFAGKPGQGRTAKRMDSRNRNRLPVAVGTVIVAAVVAILIFRNDSGNVSTGNSAATADPIQNVRAGEVQTPASAGHGPSIHFPEQEFDFGSISQGDKVSHTFLVQNKGDEPLKLIRAKGS